MDFLAENNACGQTLLKLVSRGNATIAELLRLKDNVPSVYKNPTRFEQQKYGELLNLDFNYFNSKFAENFERKVEADNQNGTTGELKAFDDALRTSYVDLLIRFYRVFESIHRYVFDLQRFIQDLDEGGFIQMSLEAVFLDEDGKQLLCESLYIYGCMLILTDLQFEGSLREKLLVAYYRYSGQTNTKTDSNFDDVCQLLRSTGFSQSATAKRPPNYPENYLNRVKLPSHFVRMALGRLRSDDIYNATRCYPDPEHRATALAEQASMLYVILYFEPDILKNETATMREIVDKFFPDNWVISVYMGTTVNLVEWWDPYKAAKAALLNTLQPSNIRMSAVKYGERLQTLLPETGRLLKEGALKEEKMLDSIVRVMNVVRDCNVTLRWIMLHTSQLTPSAESNKRFRQIRDQIISGLGPSYTHSNLFLLLLNTSQFEFRLRTMYRQLLDDRLVNFEKYRSEARVRMSKLANIYGSAESDGSTRKNVKLRDWFLARDEQMSHLTLDDGSSSSRLAAQLIEALKEAEDLEQLESNWAVKQNVEETVKFLHQIIRTASLKEDILITLQIVSDLSYAWEIVDTAFTSEMQQGLKNDPSLVGKLRATFLKLSSALERPILRISQSRSSDLVSVSEYYSSELVTYVRRVLQVIPESVFLLLDKIVRIQTESLQEVPTRLDKDKLKDFAQLDLRYEVAKLTHDISVFTEGLLAMKSTLVGVIKVDPKQLLEDGIRKELVRQVTAALHNALIFNPKAKTNELTSKLITLSKAMSGFRRSFEYIQDYVSLNGLKIWQEELSRIVGFHVEQESNVFLKQKSNLFQSRTIPIPLYPSPDPSTLTFMGRLANELISLTNPRTTIFIHARQTWFDSRTFEEVTSLTRLFPLLESAVGVFGLAGLDRLLGLRAVTTLQSIVTLIDRNIFQDKFWIEMLDNMFDSLNPVEHIVANPWRFYHQQHLSRASRPLATLQEYLLNLGQLQLLRKQIAYQLSLSAGFDAKLLSSALKTFNQSVVLNIKEKKLKKVSGNESRLIYELANYLSWCGLSDPEHQIYMVAQQPGPRLPEILFLAIIANLTKLGFSSNIGELISKKPQDLPNHLDSSVFLLGLMTLLEQYPDEIYKSILAYLTQYVRSFVSEQAGTSKVSNTPSNEALSGILFHEMLCRERNIGANINLPESIAHYISINTS